MGDDGRRTMGPAEEGPASAFDDASVAIKGGRAAGAQKGNLKAERPTASAVLRVGCAGRL